MDGFYSAALGGLVALPFMAPGLSEPRQLLAYALLGILTTGLANVLSLVGGRLIRSGEAGLVSLLDVPLNPLWVWLAFDERVDARTLIGGGIVMLANLLLPGKHQVVATAA